MDTMSTTATAPATVSTAAPKAKKTAAAKAAPAKKATTAKVAKKTAAAKAAPVDDGLADLPAGKVVSSSTAREWLRKHPQEDSIGVLVIGPRGRLSRRAHDAFRAATGKRIADPGVAVPE